MFSLDLLANLGVTRGVRIHHYVAAHMRISRCGLRGPQVLKLDKLSAFSSSQ